MSLRWGIISTIKAPLRQIADFAAHHLELGAHRLLIYLDDDNPQAFERLSQHPKIRVFKADAANWRSKSRPAAHQPRQSANARHGYRRHSGGLDWVAHIDVDEFLWPLSRLEDQLQALPEGCLCARTRPIEALSAEGQPDIPPGHTIFKATAHDRKTRLRLTDELFPTYGNQLNGGFLSHVAGKLFVRTGLEDLDIRIHNIYLDKEENPGQRELPGTELLHLHAADYAHWLAQFRYRHAEGAYRAALKPTRSRERGGLTMHELFAFILSEDGEKGLEHFYDEVCRATPALRARLEERGLLRSYALDLDAKRAKHFPDLA